MDFKDIDFRNYIESVKQHWIVALAVTLLVGSVLTVRMLKQPHVFEAVCKMEFAASGPEMSIDNGTMLRYSSYILQTLFLTSQKIIMMSDPVVDRVVKSLGMVPDGASEWQFERKRQVVSGALSIERITDSQIFLLKARHTDPKLAKQIANTTADAYIRYSYERKIDNYRKSMQWLDEELADLKAKLEQSQRNLIDFIEREKLTSFGDSDSVSPLADKRFSEVESLLEELHGRKVEEEMKLMRLSEKYLPAHPSYKNAQREVELLETKIAEETNRLGSIKNSREQEIIRSKKNEIEYSILKREVEVSKEIYNTLVRKHKETDIGSAIARTDATIIEYAKMPSMAIYPNKKLQTILAWMVGLLIGLGYCFARQIMDTSIKSPDEIEQLSSTPLLAVVPKEKDKRSGIYPIVNDENPHHGEPFRVLRTNLNFSFPDIHQGRIIMVGSTDRAEGKSTVSFNLAAVTAETGKRTLVVDGDLRARSLTNFFNFGNEQGFTNYLIGETELANVIRQTKHSNLFVLPSGPTPPRPATLLDSAAMHRFIADVRKQFDEIIIDTPPIGMVIDGSIISSLADGVVVVLGAGRVTRHEIKKTIQSLENAKARVSGFVLNKLDLRRRRYYGYGDYYGYQEESGSSETATAPNQKPSKSSDEKRDPVHS